MDGYFKETCEEGETSSLTVIKTILSTENDSSIQKLLQPEPDPEEPDEEESHHYSEIHEKIREKGLEDSEDADVDIQQVEQIINSYEQLGQNLQQLNQDLLAKCRPRVQITRISNVSDVFLCPDVKENSWCIRKENIEITESFEYVVVSKCGTYACASTTQAEIEAYIQQTENGHKIETL